MSDTMAASSLRRGVAKEELSETEGVHTVTQIENLLSQYMPLGEPKVALPKLRQICLQYLKGLGAAYPMMSSEEKMTLVRLCVFEAGKRKMSSIKEDEEALDHFKHTLEVMWTHEIVEGSSLTGVRLLTHPESPITINALQQ